MFIYEKRLQYPIRIKNTNPRLAKMIISQYGGPHGEIGASLRYLSQRYAMPTPELKAILTDIGTEGPKCPTYPRNCLRMGKPLCYGAHGDGFKGVLALGPVCRPTSQAAV